MNQWLKWGLIIVTMFSLLITLWLSIPLAIDSMFSGLVIFMVTVYYFVVAAIHVLTVWLLWTRKE